LGRLGGDKKRRLGEEEEGLISLFKLAVVGRVVGSEGEGGLELEKRVCFAGKSAADAVDFAGEDEAGVGELGLYDGAPLDGGVDVAAPGWSALWGGRVGRGAPGLKGVAIVCPFAVLWIEVISGEEGGVIIETGTNGTESERERERERRTLLRAVHL